MKDDGLIIRPAVPEDADLIARVVAMGIGDERVLCDYCGADYLATLSEIALLEDSQYSYRNTLVAERNGVAIGAAVGYDGAHLSELRSRTLSVIKSRLGRELSITDETGPGEFYLDSLAVLPDYRGVGAGRTLLSAMRDKAFAEGHKRVGLIVDCENPRAEALYASLGFKRVGEKDFFGHAMWHMQVVRL